MKKSKLKKKLKRMNEKSVLERSELKIRLEHETYRAWEAENKLRYHTEQYDLLLKKLAMSSVSCESKETKSLLTHTDAVCDMPLDKVS